MKNIKQKIIGGIIGAGMLVAVAGEALGQQKGKVFVYEESAGKNVEFSYDAKKDATFVPKTSDKPYFSADSGSDIQFSAEPNKKVFTYEPENPVQYNKE